ncbi:hypothetical protein CONLIGDRAFT_693178 [Coniochaeta ligniaria NRRL 30616]|uniref:Regulatory P domain-containing protein n=1 Tax=Coniochaeta ligniaria NRRL 30616 TaxID=1408157 RepID=A0A1J7J2P7_9PEZI|nr:hypothetical protein CONLIGDRAFT_693178 [Coniochaeta ligniaria NRRL 30616]
MRRAYLTSVTFVTLLVSCFSKELAPDRIHAELYESGLIHEGLMSQKMSTWAKQEQLGRFDSRIYSSRAATAGPVPCVNGKAAVVPGDAKNTFRCNNVDFYDFLSHARLGGSVGQGSGSWGWTSPTGREFVAIAQKDGTAFAEITSKGKLVYLGRLPQYSSPSDWREIKGYQSYMVIGSEAADHGVQIFDMHKLTTIDPKKTVTFSNEHDLTAHWNQLPEGKSHNIVINEEKKYAVAVGAQPRTDACKSGLIFIDLTDITKPTSPGCASGDGYVHDAQCLVYRGPDTKYNGKDICYGYNEDTLTMQKNVTKIISRTSYEGATYTHQGWVTNTQWQEYLVADDEWDEAKGNGPAASGYPITYFWDIRSLEKPKQTGYFRSAAKSIDHNQYIVNGLSYQSNYGAGLRILDISSLPQDPTGSLVHEVGFFDVYPEDDSDPVVDFVGTWSNYPFFKSGYILVNTIERGAYVLKLNVTK